MSERYLDNEARFGFFGKLPINGDFIHRNLPNHFIHSWDNWLQENILACKEQFQNDWLQHYLTSPIWRYFISPSVMDDNAYIGILAPSVDSVGRYFPMTIVAPISPAKVSPIFTNTFQSIYANLETVFLKHLHAEEGTISMLCEDLDTQSTALLSELNKQQIDRLPDTLDSHRFKLTDQSDMSGALSSLWMMQLMQQHTGSTLWWSNGSQAIEPSLLINNGLPNKQQFIAMLSGFENNNYWRQKNLAIPLPLSATVTDTTTKVEASMEPIQPPESPQVAQSIESEPSSGQTQPNSQSTQLKQTAANNAYTDDSSLLTNDASAVTSNEILSTIADTPSDNQPTPTTLLRQQSAGFCDIGNKRNENQDAILIHENQALWVVADGMGGHSSGDKASKTIVDQLNTLDLQGDLFANIAQIKQVLHRVNNEILEFAKAQRTTCGSTVVLLIQNNNQCAFLWAGDSRLYLQREGQLIQLTKDHSVLNLYEESGLPTENIGNNAITRAVGVDEHLDIECGYHQLQDGDRFLLCSDGLYDFVSHEQIHEGLSISSPQAAADHLKQLVLSGKATDNLSGIFIWF